jgi:tetratricopeptide (TPR) repeat protein
MKFISKAFLVPVIAGTMWACSESKSNTSDAYFEKGQFEKAAESYTEELKLKPNDVKLLYNRGRAWQELANYDNAREDFEAALSKDPKNFQVLLSLATIQLEEKNYASALLYATKAEEISGAPASASFLKARSLHHLGMTGDALKAYGNAINLDKDFAQAYFNRGMLKIALEQTKGACEDFKLALALDYPGAKEQFQKYCK